jgi:hypothetical protein
MMVQLIKSAFRLSLVLLFSLAASGCGAVDAVRRLFASSTPTPTSTPTPSPTFTPSPTPTPSQTPTATVHVAGLKLFAGEGFEITLPDTYEGGSSPEEIQAIIDSLRNGGNELVAQLAEQNKKNIRLFAIDNWPSLVFRTSAIVFGIQSQLFRGAPAATVAQFFKAQIAGLFPGSEVVEESSFAHPELDAYRFVTTVDSSSLGFDEDVVTAIVSYVFVEDDFLWVVSFATPQSELEVRMTEFNTSAASFRTTSE